MANEIQTKCDGVLKALETVGAMVGQVKNEAVRIGADIKAKEGVIRDAGFEPDTHWQKFEERADNLIADAVAEIAKFLAKAESAADRLDKDSPFRAELLESIRKTRGQLAEGGIELPAVPSAPANTPAASQTPASEGQPRDSSPAPGADAMQSLLGLAK